PLRNMHQSTEMAHQEDVAATIELLTESIKNLGNYNWDFSADHGQGPTHPDAATGDLDWL
ncbi:MAG: M42 family peptidase, partial [Bacteroidota bacterium]